MRAQHVSSRIARVPATGACVNVLEHQGTRALLGVFARRVPVCEAHAGEWGDSKSVDEEHTLPKAGVTFIAAEKR